MSVVTTTATLSDDVIPDGTFQARYPSGIGEFQLAANTVRIVTGNGNIYDGNPVSNNGTQFVVTNKSGRTLVAGERLVIEIDDRDSSDRTIESLGASPIGSEEQNSAAIQEALTRGGHRTLLLPGTYAILDDDFVAGEDSAIYIGPGVEFSVSGTVMLVSTLNDIDVGPASENVRVVVSGIAQLVPGASDVVVDAREASSVSLILPEGGTGIVSVVSANGVDEAAIAVTHKQNAIRMANSGSSVVLPSISMYATADAGWTLGMLVRLTAENLQTGTTHLRFCRIGAGAAYGLVGYEGPNASNPFVMKLLMPNAAASGVTSLRQGLNSIYSPFHTSRVGDWVWIFVRKHDAALSEQILQMSNGAEVTGVFTDETITLAWCPIQPDDPSGVVVYAGSAGIAAGTFSAATAAVTVGPDSSVTGGFDIAKLFFLTQCVSAANLGKLATGKRPQDIGLTVNNSTDIYYEFVSTTASSLVDVLGGTAATSVTLAGSDGATPFADLPIITQYLGGVTDAEMRISYADGQARLL